MQITFPDESNAAASVMAHGDVKGAAREVAERARTDGRIVADAAEAAAQVERTNTDGRIPGPVAVGK